KMPALEQRLDEQMAPHPFGVGGHLLDILIRQLIAQELHRSNLGEGFPDGGLVDATVGGTDLPFAERAMAGLTGDSPDCFKDKLALLDQGGAGRILRYHRTID